MCQHDILYFDDNTGCVIKCRSCNKIQVGFGMLSITFDEPGFEVFRHTIGRYWNNRNRHADTRIKSVLIPSPCEGMNLLLSLRELETLHGILEQADNEMKALHLIGEFERSDRC